MQKHREYKRNEMIDTKLNPRAINGYDNAEDGNAIVLNNGSLEFGEVSGYVEAQIRNRIVNDKKSGEPKSVEYYCDKSVGCLYDEINSGKLVTAFFYKNISATQDLVSFEKGTKGIVQRGVRFKFLASDVNNQIIVFTGCDNYDNSTEQWAGSDQWIREDVYVLTDAMVNDPQDGQLLVYNLTNQQWENANVEASNIVVRNWTYQ